MKIIKCSLLLLIVLFSTISIYAQTVDEIIAKHIDSVGGKEKISGITSLRLETTLEVMGTSGTSTTTILNGKGFRNQSDVNGQQVISVYTDKGGWQINPFAGVADPQPMTDEQYKAGEDQIFIEPFLDYAARGSKVELLGQEKIGNLNTYKIKFTNKDNAVTTYYIDASGFQIVQVVATANSMGQEVEITTTMSDFKKTDYGIVIPQASEINFGGQFTLVTKMQKVEVNPSVDVAIFEMKK